MPQYTSGTECQPGDNVVDQRGRDFKVLKVGSYHLMLSDGEGWSPDHLTFVSRGPLVSTPASCPSHYFAAGVECHQVVAEILSRSKVDPVVGHYWASGFEYFWRLLLKGQADGDVEKIEVNLRKLRAALDADKPIHAQENNLDNLFDQR